MRVVIIPARGGSKRIPRKNIRLFGGIPIIAHPIKAAKDTELFQHVVVSTEDDEVASVATAYGADLIIERPKDLAADTTPTRPVINHAIEQLQKAGINPEYVCCLYPTSALVRTKTIQHGYQTLIETKADFVCGIIEYSHPIQRALYVTPENRIGMDMPEQRHTRTQMLEKRYHDSGQFYIGRRDAYLQNLPMHSHHTVPIILSRLEAQDIDTEDDWHIAELMHERLNRRVR